jgi:gas vesicle protein
MGLLTGTVLGAGVAMLFAPKSGAELRDDLSARADTLASRTRDGFRTAAEHVEQWVEKGKEAAATVAGVAGGRPS